MIPKAIRELERRLQKNLNPNALMKHLFQQTSFRKLIIDLNTEEQLYSQGVDSKGVQLGEYSIYTKGLKQNKGQRTDHITLKDTGEFYKSFSIRLEGSSFRIIADGQKEDTNLFKEYGIDILGLTQDSMSVVVTAAVPIIQKYIKANL